MGLDEFFGLDEHAAGAAGGVVAAAGVGLEHLDEDAADSAGGVELAAELAFGGGELAQEVFVDAAEEVARPAAFSLEADAGDDVDKAIEIDGLDAMA